MPVPMSRDDAMTGMMTLAAWYGLGEGVVVRFRQDYTPCEMTTSGARAGEQGVITHIETDWCDEPMFFVLLDNHHPDLDEWDNELQVLVSPEEFNDNGVPMGGYLPWEVLRPAPPGGGYPTVDDAEYDSRYYRQCDHVNNQCCGDLVRCNDCGETWLTEEEE